MKKIHENSELRSMALKSLEGKWGLAIGALVVLFLLSIIISTVSAFIPYHVGNLIYLVIEAPMQLGMIMFILSLSRGEEASIEQIFKGYNNFTTAVLSYLLMVVFIFLWSLLLIIPGIIAAFSYSMVFYIISDEPDITPMDALKKSKEMMDGYKIKFFLLGLSFIGWFLLSILTFGIGLLWVIPYMQVSMAKFYDDIKGDTLISVSDSGDILDTNI